MSNQSKIDISVNPKNVDDLTPSNVSLLPYRYEDGRKGLFAVIDGPDGTGKGEIETALRRCEERDGKSVLDVISWSKAHERLPELEDFWAVPTPHFNTLITAEPTYVGMGKDIRTELTSRNERTYPSRVEIEAYSINRLIQMKQVVVPALERGLNVIQSRCFAATLAYQWLTAQKEGKDFDAIKKTILEHPGNVYQAKHRPDLLIFTTIDSAGKIIERLKRRGVNEKEDISTFENFKFQESLKPIYESEWMRDIFTGLGTHVAYLNAGLTIESSRTQAADIYQSFKRDGKIPELYQSPKSVLCNITDKNIS